MADTNTHVPETEPKTEPTNEEPKAVTDAAATAPADAGTQVPAEPTEALARDAAGAELRESADAGVKALIEGVELTEREFLKVLEKRGVQKLEPLGAKFDPNFHQAMYEVPDASVPPGTVVQVVQSGYTIGDRVLRPALVALAKGGAKPAADPANDNAGQRSDDRDQRSDDRNSSDL